MNESMQSLWVLRIFLQIRIILCSWWLSLCESICEHVKFESRCIFNDKLLIECTTTNIINLKRNFNFHINLYTLPIHGDVVDEIHESGFEYISRVHYSIFCESCLNALHWSLSVVCNIAFRNYLIDLRSDRCSVVQCTRTNVVGAIACSPALKGPETRFQVTGSPHRRIVAHMSSSHLLHPYNIIIYTYIYFLNQLVATIHSCAIISMAFAE